MTTALPAKPDYQLITDPDEFSSLADRLIAEAKPVGYDIETSSEGEPRADAAKHPEENFICGFSLTNSPSWARAVPIAFEDGPNIDPRFAAECLWRLAAARDGDGRPLLVPHNAIFELRCTARLFEKHLGLPLEEAYFQVRSDTMVEAYIEAAHESYALKSLTWETFGHQMTEIMELFGDGLTQKAQSSIQFHLLDQTDPKVSDYMCEDALWALAHHLKRFPKVTDPAFRGAFLFKVDMALLPVLCAMSDTGMAYDWNRMREAAQRGEAFMGRLVTEINASLAEQLGRPVALNLASPAQIAKVLYEDLGLPVKRRSKKTGKPSTDKMAVKALASEHPVVKRIQDYRRIKRLCKDNYAGKYEQDYNYAPDGRAHPNILPCAVTTGRLAFSRPAAQQPPKAVKYALASGETFEFAWRDCITVPPAGALGDEDRYGWYILGFDLSQCLAPETRVCTADLRWVPIGSVQPGDELIGFDEFAGDYKGPGRRAKLKPAVVETTRRLVKDCYRVKLSDGREITAAGNHMWVEVGTSSGSTRETGEAWRGSTYVPKQLRKWKRTDELVPGKSRLCHWVQPWDELSSEYQYEAGWLAGFADGEGWVFGNHGCGRSGSALYVGLAQNPGPVWDRVAEVCKLLGYDLSKIYRQREGSAAALSGKRVEKRYLNYESSVRFLGQCRPVRLGGQSRRFWEGRQTYTQSSAAVEVVSVDHLGPREVVAVQTSARTYIAEGLLSHNCELRAMAGEAQEPALLDAYARGDDVHRVSASKMLGIPFDKVDDAARSIGKTLNLALQYQLSAPSLAERLGVPKEEGQRLYDAWFAAYPRVKAWTEATVAQAIKDGYTLSRFGRKHPIWEFAKICQFCRSNGVVSKWTSGQTRCPRCNGLGTPKSMAVIAHGERLAGNAPIQGAATGDAMRIAMVRARKALHAAGMASKVHMFLNVHDSLDFYVRKDVPPGEVIAVLQPAVVFPIEGWPEVVADWHAGTRMGSLAELEVGPDFEVKVKGAKEETAVPGDEDEDDDVDLPAVDVSAVRAVAGGRDAEVPVVSRQPVQAAEPAAVADSCGLDGGDVARDLESRTVIVTVPSGAGSTPNLLRLKAVLEKLPGPNTVILRVAAGDVKMPGTSGLTPAHQSDVAFILPGAVVTYDGGSVDYAAIAAGITV